MGGSERETGRSDVSGARWLLAGWLIGWLRLRGGENSLPYAGKDHISPSQVP